MVNKVTNVNNSKDIMSIFKERLKKARLKAGFTSQDVFAKKVGVNRVTINYYEQGSRKPDIEVFMRIAEVLNVSYDYLLGYSDTPIREYHDTKEITGLTDDAINLLNIIVKKARKEKSNPKYNTSLLETLSYVIENEEDYKILNLISAILRPSLVKESTFNTSPLVYGPSDMYYTDLLKLALQLNKLREHKEAELSSTTGRNKR